MNEYVIPNWFMQAMVFCAVAQIILLLVACKLIRVWAGTLNRKLHRIESNTRHAAISLAPEEQEEEEEEEVLGRTT